MKPGDRGVVRGQAAQRKGGNVWIVMGGFCRPALWLAVQGRRRKALEFKEKMLGNYFVQGNWPGG